jgi:restriction system protein
MSPTAARLLNGGCLHCVAVPKSPYRPGIHKFVGVLHGRRARKRIFVTISPFTGEDVDYADQIGTKIVLVDGCTLARLMIIHDVGCAPAQTFVVKTLDSDYFIEE